mgnify:CR=1 FL=1
MLQIKHLEKSYQDRIILNHISLTIEKPGLYGVVGVNGAGKTTFFKCLSGLEPYQGEILYNKKTLSSDQVAFVPTEPYLYDHLTVGEFYSFYRKLLGIKTVEKYTFEIDKNTLIKRLSTGMRKKVYYNAVLQKPYTLYIFDEPFNGLDIASVIHIKKLLHSLAQTPIVLVASHLLESLQACVKIYLLQHLHFQAFAPEQIPFIESILIE